MLRMRMKLMTRVGEEAGEVRSASSKGRRKRAMASALPIRGALKAGDFTAIMGFWGRWKGGDEGGQASALGGRGGA